MSLQRKREQDTQTEGYEEEEDRSKWMIPITTDNLPKKNKRKVGRRDDTRVMMKNKLYVI